MPTPPMNYILEIRPRSQYILESGANLVEPRRPDKKYRTDFYSPLTWHHDLGGRPSDLLLNLALATKLSLVAGPRAAARRHEGAPKDVLDAPEQRAIMTDCSADAARPNLPEP